MKSAGENEYISSDSTLREGEQFAGASLALSSAWKIPVARCLRRNRHRGAVTGGFSPTTANFVRTLCSPGLRASILAHVRCVEADVQAALDLPIAGVDLFSSTRWSMSHAP